jgi:hypothetical protein
MYLADLYASGGVAQFPDRRTDDQVQRFFELIQSDPGFLAETANEVGLYYSLGNHMGDVGRPGVGVWAYYGAARLLEDTHHSYDVLYQGDPNMGPGTIQWVEQQVTAADLAGYGMVVLPNTTHMTDAEVANLMAWVEAGGVLVVFGDAGTHDFSYPEPARRDDAAWSAMTTTPGTTPHGSGTAIVFPGNEWSNLATRYDGSLDPADFTTFVAAVDASFASDITTDAGPLVHVHRFADSATGREILHLVNFDYDDTSDKVRSTSDNVFAFAPRRQYVQPKITYYTPNSPEGVMLPVTQLDSGYIQVLIPGLHVYGIVAVEEQG